jgi:hypothetical protein
MTAPAPALTALLDGLDRLRAAASEGPWTVEADGYGVDCLVTRPGPGGPGLVAAAISKTADAALIVAAVNAAPRLTAAVRATLALADELTTEAEHSGPAKGAAYRIAADRLRTTITAAFVDEATP